MQKNRDRQEDKPHHDRVGTADNEKPEHGLDEVSLVKLPQAGNKQAKYGCENGFSHGSDEWLEMTEGIPRCMWEYLEPGFVHSKVVIGGYIL